MKVEQQETVTDRENFSIISMDDIQRLYHERCAIEGRKGYWFTPDTLAFFDSKLSSYGYLCPHKAYVYFVSSEKRPEGPGELEPTKRLYTIRKMSTTGTIYNLGESMRYKSEKSAFNALTKLLLVGGDSDA